VQDLPDKTLLLQAVATFLVHDVGPAIESRSLSFRLRIAAHLLGAISAELEHEHAHDRIQLQRLQEVLGHDPEVPDAPPALREAIRRLERDLAARLRHHPATEDEQAAIRHVLLATLRDKLKVNQPRFDTRLNVEEPA